MAIDYNFKSKVLKTDLCSRLKVIDRNDYIRAVDGLIVDKNNDEKYVDLFLQYGNKMIKEARRINDASYKRIQRLRDRISRYLSLGKCIFVTLTFSDDVLRDTSEFTRRRYVSRYLKSISDYYVANIDYGADDRFTHREHYHALILIDYINERWDYGIAWFEPIHTSDSEITIAKYISKLTNHAIKESTKRHVYIYSRR